MWLIPAYAVLPVSIQLCFQVLIPKLRGSDQNPMVIASVLRAIGDLAQVGGTTMKGNWEGERVIKNVFLTLGHPLERFLVFLSNLAKNWVKFQLRTIIEKDPYLANLKEPSWT